MSGVRAHVRRNGALSLVRVLSVLLVSLGAGLAVVSCGGDDQLSQQEYERELDEAGQEIESAFDGVREELQGVGQGSASLDDAAEQIDEAQSRLDSAREDLEELEPPEDAAEAHDELVEGLGDLSAEFGEFRDALDSGSVPRVQRFVQEFDGLDAVERIERAVADLERQGYDLSSTE